MVSLSSAGERENLHQAHLLPPADMSKPVDARQSVIQGACYNGTRTESIDKQVVPMILPQDLHLARVLADGKTVEEEEDLHAERDGDRDDGR